MAVYLQAAAEHRDVLRQAYLTDRGRPELRFYRKTVQRRLLDAAVFRALRGVPCDTTLFVANGDVRISCHGRGSRDTPVPVTEACRTLMQAP